MIPTRRTLLNRLKNWEDQESWEDFVRLYQQLIHRTALQAGLPESAAQDVVQETLLSVAKQMPGFTYDPAVGSFKSWLRAITRRRIIDHLRRLARDPARPTEAITPTQGTAAIERMPAPRELDLEAIWEAEYRQGLFQRALELVRTQVDPRQFQIFDCYVLKEWPVEDVVRTLNVSANLVYVVKHRVSALLKKQVERLEKSLA